MNDRIELAKEFAKSIKSDNIVQIILYGSVARGDDTEESDIDILIISDHQNEIQDKITSESFKIVLNNQEVITPIIMSTDRINKINDFTFMRNIRRDGIVIGWGFTKRNRFFGEHSIGWSGLKQEPIFLGNYRNSIALAYYSMFSMARALLLIKGYTPKKHEGLIRLFGKEYVLGEGFDSDLASKFSQAHAIREKASYAFVDDFTIDDALEGIELAEKFIEEAKRFL